MARKRRRFQSIRAKMALLVVSAVSLAVGSAALMQSWHLADRRYEALLDQLDGVAAALATAVAPAQARGEYHAVMKTLRAIGRMPKVRYAQIVDSNGALIARFGNGVVLARDINLANAEKEPGLLKLLSITTLPVTAPIIDGGQQLATLTLIADVSELRDVLRDSILYSVAIAGFAALIGILIALRMQKAITKPILSLKTAMQEVRDAHDYARVVPRISNDETGDLVDAFNDMLSEIRKRDRALTQHRETLEQTVEVRTHDLRKATEDAETANAAKSDFLATMSHEIRTPMNGMLVMAELLTASGLPPRLQRYADVVVSSGQSLLSIINDILDFSKIEAGKMELEAIPAKPRKMIDEVTRLFAERAASKGLDIAGLVDPDVPAEIIADPVRLNQVLANLVNNALKFTQSGGVTVHVSRADPLPDDGKCALRFAVTDTGIGIPQDRLSSIFEAFSQADQSTTRKFGGTGIGLAICQRLAKAMSGRIDVTSQEGQGSTFALIAGFDVFTSAAVHQIHHSTTVPADAAIVLVLDEGPTARALTMHASAAGFAVHRIDPDTRQNSNASLPQRTTVCAIISHQDHIDDDQDANPDGVYRVVLEKLGDTSATGETLRLSWPIADNEATVLFSALRSDDVAHLMDDTTAQITVSPDVAYPGVQVLAADDSAINREVLSEALARLGITVHSVENGRRALEAIQTRTYDLVFMDGSMPELDGFEATRAIRDHLSAEADKHLPIIALTAHVVGHQAELWREAGMDDCITKPFTIDALTGCLARWLPDRATKVTDPRRAPTTSEMTPAPPDTQHSTEPNQTNDLLDSSVLEQIREMQSSGIDLVGRVVGLYRMHAPEAVANIKAVWNQGDHASIGEAVHALKSLSRNIGAVAVGDACEILESAARDGTLNCDDHNLDDLDGLLELTLKALPQSANTTTQPTAQNERIA